jgi:hypothetical protein
VRRPAFPALVAAAIAGAAALLVAQSSETPKSEALPQLGTRLAPLPDGAMKEVADQACLNCHSADMIRQQRLTEKQWTANVTKMIGWGAAVPEDRKDALVAYLVEHFGPENERFQPVETAPAPK